MLKKEEETEERIARMYKGKEEHLNRPDVERSIGILNWFWSISRQREYHNGPLPLKLSDIMDYGAAFGTGLWDIDSFIEIITQLDNYYLDKAAKKDDWRNYQNSGWLNNCQD